MALMVNNLDSRLQIQMHLGVNEDGKDVTRTKSYSRIRSQASDQDLYDVALSLAALQEHPVVAIRRNSNASYEEE